MRLIDTTIDQLLPSSANVRTTRPEDAALLPLAESIVRTGLLQALLVEEQAGRLLVLDGERRRRAIRLAIDKEMLPADFPVPCLIGAGHGKAWAESASLATFVHREAIHPADEAVAYATLAGKGLGVREIGKRFGCTTSRIR